MDLTFLDNLRENNNREWFLEHKNEYLSLKEEFDEFTNKLIEGIYLFDSSVGIQTAKTCTYRIYRDVRFSKEKYPYKFWMGAYICPGGKKSGNPGYYFHVEPDGGFYLEGNLLATGLYFASPEVLRNVRRCILYQGDKFDKAVKAAKNFHLDESMTLQKVPAGYPKEHQYSHYLRLRNYCLTKTFQLKGVSNEQLLKTALEEFKTTAEFCRLLMDWMY